MIYRYSSVGCVVFSSMLSKAILRTNKVKLHIKEPVKYSYKYLASNYTHGIKALLLALKRGLGDNLTHLNLFLVQIEFV